MIIGVIIGVGITIVILAAFVSSLHWLAVGETLGWRPSLAGSVGLVFLKGWLSRPQ